MPKPKSKEQLSILEKLHPTKVRLSSPMIHSVIAYLVGAPRDETFWVKPIISALSVTSDDFVLAQREGDVGLNDFLGALNDITSSIHQVADEFLTLAEKNWLIARIPVNKWKKDNAKIPS